MTRSNRKQHYVPEYYLKNFADNNYLHIYDLKNKTKFSNSISNTAYRKNFYNVNCDFFNKIIIGEQFEDSHFIDKIINKYNESILARFFDSFNPTRERILKKDNRTTISLIDFHSLVDFILVQFYRNPKLSILFKHIDDLAKNKYQADNTIEFDKITRGIVILLLFNELHYGRKTNFIDEIRNTYQPITEEIKTIKDLITNSYKIVYWNKTALDFVTSDCAMSFMRLNDEDLFSTIFVPINTNVAVVLINKDSSSFDQTIEENGTIIQLEEEDKIHVETYNMSIIENANRFVYSKNGRFPDTIHTVNYKEWWNL